MSLTHALTLCPPIGSSQICSIPTSQLSRLQSSIRTDFTSVLELDRSANLARASHRHHPQVGPVHYTYSTATP